MRRGEPIRGVGAVAQPEWAEAQLQARAAWYYYMGGMTQQEIADRLGLTRLRVNRIIGLARSEGLIQIDLRLPLANCVELEERVRERFGLDDVSVIPSIADADRQQQAIGEAAGAALDRLIGDGSTLGVGWGRTLRAAARRLLPHRIESGSVTSLMGGLTRGSGTNTFEVATEFARMLGTECHYMTAPIYCPSSDSRSVLMTHYGLAAVMRRAREASIALVSCGDLTPRSLLASTQVVGEQLDSLVRAGAVGDLLGTFLDRDGQAVKHSLNERVMALGPDELRACPCSILASGGETKLPVILAILRAGYVRRLVTDEGVAAGLLGGAA